MLDKLGLTGVFGFLLMLAGIAIIAWKSLVVAAGLAFVIAGTGLVVSGLVKNVMRQFGMA